MLELILFTVLVILCAFYAWMNANQHESTRDNIIRLFIWHELRLAAERGESVSNHWLTLKVNIVFDMHLEEHETYERFMKRWTGCGFLAVACPSDAPLKFKLCEIDRQQP